MGDEKDEHLSKLKKGGTLIMALKVFLSIIWFLFGSVVLAGLQNAGIMLGGIPAFFLMLFFISVFWLIWGKIKLDNDLFKVSVVIIAGIVVVLLASFIMNTMYGDDNNPTTYLLKALEKGNYEVAGQAIRSGANVNESIAGRPLIFAYAEDEFTEQLSFLIRRGADINARTKYGRTPLHEAALNGNIKTVKILIESGANVNVKNNRGETPLFYAEKGLVAGPPRKQVHKDIARLLRKHGATY